MKPSKAIVPYLSFFILMAILARAQESPVSEPHAGKTSVLRQDLPKGSTGKALLELTEAVTDPEKSVEEKLHAAKESVRGVLNEAGNLKDTWGIDFNPRSLKDWVSAGQALLAPDGVPVCLPRTLGQVSSVQGMNGETIPLKDPKERQPTLLVIPPSDTPPEKLEKLFTEVTAVAVGVDVLDKTLKGDLWGMSPEEIQASKDLRLVVLADVRPTIQKAIEEGETLKAQLRQDAINKGSREGARQGYAKGSNAVLLFKRASKRRAARAGRGRSARRGRMGANIGSGIGASTGAGVFDTLVPYKAAELMEKAIFEGYEGQPGVTAQLEAAKDKLAKYYPNPDGQLNFGVMVDREAFDDLEELRDPASLGEVNWANSQLSKSPKDRLDVSAALAAHENFKKKTNSADNLLRQKLGLPAEGFHVVLLGTDGEVLRKWTNGEIDPKLISMEYFALQMAFKDNEFTKNKLRKVDPNDYDCDGVVNAQDKCSETEIEMVPATGTAEEKQKVESANRVHKTGRYAGCNKGEVTDEQRRLSDIKYNYPDKDKDGDGIANRLDKCPRTHRSTFSTLHKKGAWIGCAGGQKVPYGEYTDAIKKEHPEIF